VTVDLHTDRTVDEILGQFLADPTVTTVGGAIGAALVALWLAAAWWAYSDASRRTDSIPAALLVAGWIVVSTPLLVPLSLAVYVLARPQQTAAERRTRRLAAELVDELDELAPVGCLSCGKMVEQGWLRCPSCTTWLALPCAQCGRWSEGNLALCPYCGGEDRGEASVEALQPAAPAARQRRGRRPIRAIGPGRAAPTRPGQRPRLAPDGRVLEPIRIR
jgi:RNA polymerase subunit RPABC4/transcription elongation factor Spt4